MPNRPVPSLLLFMSLQACLPPPRAWVLEGARDTGSAPQTDDTAVAEIPCSSIRFLPDGSGEEGDLRSQLSIFNDVLTEGGFAVDGSFTLEFYTWFINIDPGETRTLVSLGQDMAWRLKVDGPQLVFEIRDHEDEIRTDVPAVGFHHIALVYNAELSVQRMSLYVDGTREGEALAFGGPWPAPESDSLRIARAGDGSPSWASQRLKLAPPPSAEPVVAAQPEEPAAVEQPVVVAASEPEVVEAVAEVEVEVAAEEVEVVEEEKPVPTRIDPATIAAASADAAVVLEKRDGKEEVLWKGYEPGSLYKATK